MVDSECGKYYWTALKDGKFQWHESVVKKIRKSSVQNSEQAMWNLNECLIANNAQRTHGCSDAERLLELRTKISIRNLPLKNTNAYFF